MSSRRTVVSVMAAGEGASFLLPETVWQQYDWSVQHCVLHRSNEPIRL